jgi:hypothetical protein
MPVVADPESREGVPKIVTRRSRGPTPETDDEIPLFPTEGQIARLVLGRGRKEWEGIAIVLETYGLPKIDPMMGGRYWPAVKAFFDHRAGLATQFAPPVRDGVENWPVSRRRIVAPWKN